MIDLAAFGLAADGDCDCTAALQQAVDTGGGLRLPAGRYRITSPVEVDLARVGPFELTGEPGATIVNACAGPALRIRGSHDGTAAPDSVSAQTYLKERSPRIVDLEIVGDHPEAVGIELSRCFKPVVRGVFVRGCRIGLHLIERNRDVLIEGCHVYDNRGPGIFLDRLNLHQINITGCHISYNQGGGIVVHGSEIRNLQITGCDIEYNYPRDDAAAPPTADIWIETRGSSVREGAITGCTVQALPYPGGANIRMIGESEDRAHKVGLFQITGNLITSQETQIHLRYARGVAIGSNCFGSGGERNLVIEDSSQITVSGNVFDSNPDYRESLDGIRLERAAGVTLTGNQFAGTRHPEAVVDLADSRDILFGSNQILDPIGAGVRLRGCTRVRLQGLTIADQRGEMPYAVRVADSRNCAIRDCRFTAGSAGVVEADESLVETDLEYDSD